MIDPLRWYLLAGMVAHKLVWEALRPPSHLAGGLAAPRPVRT